MSEPEDWCQSTEEQPDEIYEEDVTVVQADYIPDRWSE